MEHKYCLVKSRVHKGFTFPAKVFGYLALCENLRRKRNSLIENENTNNLPLFSSITSKYTPEGVVHSHWSFLKYTH